MRISVSTDSHRVQLLDPSNFTGFDVVADPTDAPERMVAEALGDLGERAGDDHVWMSVAGVRSLAGDAVDAEWEAGYQAMLGYAAGKGWLNDEATMIRAHIDRG